MSAETAIPTLLALAWLLPLVSFAIIAIGYSVPQLLGSRASYHSSKYAAYIAVGAIGSGFLLSLIALFGFWLPAHPLSPAGHHGAEHHESGHDTGVDTGNDGHAQAAPVEGRASVRPASTHGETTPVQLAALAQVEPTEGAETAEDSEPAEDVEPAEDHAAHGNNSPPPYLTGNWYTLARFGDLELTIGYYVDTLTVTMFCMVTLIATCVHVYAMGYMHDELHDYTDPEVELNGQKLKRPGRYHRFFQYLSLFSFSMLGIVIAGNLAMVFVFWELVGICS